jgi:hypothetical protein
LRSRSESRCAGNRAILTRALRSGASITPCSAAAQSPFATSTRLAPAAFNSEATGRLGTRIAPRPPGHRGRLPVPGSHRTWRADFPHHALRPLVHSTASACNSRYGRRSFGRSSGVRCLI